MLEKGKKTPKVAAVAFPPPREHSKSWFLHLENRAAVAGRPEPEATLETSHIMRLSDRVPLGKKLKHNLGRQLVLARGKRESPNTAMPKS